MSFLFESEDRDPVHLTNDDYGKVVSFYSLEHKDLNEILDVLKSKFSTGDLQKTVTRLRRY